MTYQAATGKCDTQATIDRFDEFSTQAFSRAVAHLAVETQDKWDDPHAKKLKGKAKLHEIRFKANRCQTRAIGFFGPRPGLFTITLICTHKQNVYQPVEAIETAGRRLDAIVKGQAQAVALQIHGEDFPAHDDPP